MFTFLLLISCSSKPRVDARIFERKYLDNGKLQLKFKLNQNGQEIIDSLVMENKVVDHDTILIEYYPGEPAKTKVTQ